MSKLIDELDSLRHLLEPDQSDGHDILSTWPLRESRAARAEEHPADAMAAHSQPADAEEALALQTEEAHAPDPLPDDVADGGVDAIPLLEEIVDEFEGHPPASGEAGGLTATDAAEMIPILDEVADTGQEHAADGDDEHTPEAGELLGLIDMLVERRLQRLKPDITELVIEELQAIYPALLKD